MTTTRTSHLLIAITIILGTLSLAWPLLMATPASGHDAHANTFTWTFLVLPLLIALVINESTRANFSVKQFAVMGIATAVATAVRPLGLGIAGIEPMWIVLIVAGAAMGPIAGFIVGGSAMVTSGIVTGGVGPWLPYQMFLAALIGYGAGFIHHRRPKIEVVALSIYGAVAAFLFGWLMNLWFWPSTVGLDSAIAFNPELPVLDRVFTWMRFSLLTSVGIDVPRAILTATGIALTATPLLKSIRRAFRPSKVSVTDQALV